MRTGLDDDRLRERMVAQQIVARGVRSERVLAALRKVRREEYVPEDLRQYAYEDRPLPIGAGQTISQPYIVAFMLEALRLCGQERVLEIGSGSGYAAALLAECAAQVFTVERHAELASAARARLERGGYGNVQVRVADGTLGWPEAAPFDAIVIAASGPRVPQGLLRQLAPGGRLLMPVGSSTQDQQLVRVMRAAAESFVEEALSDVRFVPLVGAQGWPE